MKTSEKYDKYVIGNYGKRSFEIAKAQGAYVYTPDGKRYLDFGTGIAVMSLGHANKAWIKALTAQAQDLVHCSNLYLNKPQADLAEELVGKIGSGKVFFCNSGAEANEALIKAARLYGIKKFGEKAKKYKIITAIDGFHGRTYGSMSATAQEKIQKNFSPLCEGFLYAKFNDLKSFEEKFSDEVAAVLIEPIQGESGVCPADKAFLKGLKALCKKHSSLLLFDEVQTGIGRTGKFLAYEHYGVKPDGISMAKGLGSGFPLGGIWLSKANADLFEAGSHGTTFGGNALAMSAGLATLKEIDKKNLIENAHQMGEYLKTGLEAISKLYKDKINLVRGKALLLAVLLNESYSNIELCKKLNDNGLILVPAGNNALRFLPPLNVKKTQIDSALKIFKKTIEEV